MSFIIYDVVFLVIFTLFVVIFLYKKRKNLKREGALYLYKTKIGIKLIDSFTKKNNKLLLPLQYLIVVCGYFLLFFGIYAILKFAYFYITSPIAAKALKVPVIMPLIPYLPELFKINFLPPFYFTYWILIIAAIAIPHEFAHGIFARLNNIKILSTGFGFLGPFIAAFVEQDDKQMKKRTIFSQLSVLAAGTFANILVGIIFALILWIFFVSAFSPTGIIFNSYSLSEINISQISSISSLENSTMLKIESQNKTFFIEKETFNNSIKNNLSSIYAFDDSPAFNAKLSGAIIEADFTKIKSYNDLISVLKRHSPGDTIEIKTFNGTSINSYNVVLGEKEGKTFLGIGIYSSKRSGIFGLFYNIINKIRDPNVYYQSTIGDFGVFILDLLWWLVLVSFSVALMNMIPAGIFDGGRFFYLTILGFTKNEKIAKYSFAFTTWLLLALLLLMLMKWVFAFFL
ncbi:MAG: site-2 protease family protein [Candidatus Pacearchaeota archaeon]|nr:site-2 protease family protein [Candidatus Pacearchaeota archaeon]